nr:MAG TPA: hypothetical protein [Caudoviricetes sp.]
MDDLCVNCVLCPLLQLADFQLVCSCGPCVYL